MAVEQDFANAISTIVAQLGSSYTHETTAGVQTPVRVAVATLGREDAELVNALGVDARVAYMLPMTPAPQKFDTLTGATTGSVYTVHDAHSVVVNDVIVGHKLIIQE